MSSKELGKTTGKNVLSDKAPYPKFMGIDEAMKLAKKLVDQANQEHASFDSEKAAPLYYFTNYIDTQQN